MTFISFDFIKAKNKNGSVTVDGVEYALKQQAYISDCGTEYKASAINADNQPVTIYWAVTSDDPISETDESNMCDWDNARVVAG